MKLTLQWLQFLSIVAISTAIPQPITATKPGASTTPSTPDNVTSFSRGVRPPNPPGFTTTAQIDINTPQSQCMHKYDVYLAVITFMHLRTSFAWNEWIHNIDWMYHSDRSPRNPIVIRVREYEPKGFHVQRMTNGHVMLALWAAVVATIDESLPYNPGDTFFPVKIVVNLFGKSVGEVSVYPAALKIGVGNGTAANSTRLTMRDPSDGRISALSTDNAFPDRGRITDARFPDLAITYQFVKRDDPDDYNVFTPFMEAMIILAYDGPFVLFIRLEAVSIGRHVGYTGMKLELKAAPSALPAMELVSAAVLLLAAMYARAFPPYSPGQPRRLIDSIFSLEQEVPRSRSVVQVQGSFRFMKLPLRLTVNASVATA